MSTREVCGGRRSCGFCGLRVHTSLFFLIERFDLEVFRGTRKPSEEKYNRGGAPRRTGSFR